MKAEVIKIANKLMDIIDELIRLSEDMLYKVSQVEGNDNIVYPKEIENLREGKSVIFRTGIIITTPSINSLMRRDKEFANFIFESLDRHVSGDWGDIPEEDKKANDYAIGRFERIFSGYIDRKGRKIWIITEADRSATTILFPEEY